MRFLSAVAIALAVLALVPGHAAAAVEDIIVGGVLVLRVRAGGDGLSAAQRGVLLHQRITNALSIGPVTPEQITMRVIKGDPAIYVRDVLIITVVPEDARLNGMTREALASLWLQNLRRALPRALPKPVGRR
jgi:hypothetical protein